LLNTVDPSPTSDNRARIRSDLLDLAILWADLHVQVATPDQIDQARREALQVFAEAEREFGTSIVLSRERQKVAAALGRDDLASQAAQQVAALTPQTAWEHYAIGRSLLRAGQEERAANQFRQAVDHDPQEFWPNFDLGICAYRQRQFETALAAFSACIAIRPDRAECYLNRGLAYQALDCGELAAHDFAAARQLDPSLEVVTLADGGNLQQVRRQSPTGTNE
jgi:tetratricopeptide (TPR) repeat protein